MRVVKIGRCNVTDAGDRNLRRIDGVTKGNAGENCDLVARIQAIEVQAWISFGIAGLLRLSQRLRELDSVLLHLREDVIAGAVHDAVDGLNLVRGQRLGNGADHWDAARDTCFNANGQVLLLCQREQLLAMQRDQCLVGRNHCFAVLQARADYVIGNIGATHRFYYDIDIVRACDLPPVRFDAHAIDSGFESGRRLTSNPGYVNGDSVSTKTNCLRVASQDLRGRAPDRAVAHNTDADFRPWLDA